MQKLNNKQFEHPKSMKAIWTGVGIALIIILVFIGGYLFSDFTVTKSENSVPIVENPINRVDTVYSTDTLLLPQEEIKTVIKVTYANGVPYSYVDNKITRSYRESIINYINDKYKYGSYENHFVRSYYYKGDRIFFRVMFKLNDAYPWLNDTMSFQY